MLRSRILWLALPLLLVACSREEPTAPELAVALDTQVTVSKVADEANGARFLFQFEGAERYQWQLSEPVAAGAAVKGPFDDAWQEAASPDLDLVLSFPDVDGQGPISRTLWARAIDRSGRADATPARVSFGERSLPPVATIVAPAPIATNTCQSSSAVVSLRWELDDPDNSRGTMQSRYVTLKLGDASSTCLTRAEYELQNPIAALDAKDPRWREWRDYDPADPASSSAAVDQFEVGDNWIFAVQARDGLGATSSDFPWGVSARHFRRGTNQFPVLNVAETSLGNRSYVGPDALAQFEVPAGSAFDFSWSADASSYGGSIVGYRWGRNVADPDDPFDPGWAGDFSIDATSASFSVSQGTPNFVVQAMDDSGAITQVVYILQVI